MNSRTYVKAKDVCKSRQNQENPYLVKRIANDMFLKGSEHLQRMEGFGKRLSQETIYQRRLITEKIIKDFGERDISSLPLRDIESLLIRDKSHSGSWKNFYLSTFAAIYEETKWKCPRHVSRPQFQRFALNTRKCDILSTSELNTILQKKWWKSYTEYLLYLCIASCGLRIGEARALKTSQFLFQEKILVVNGFCKRNGTRTNYNKKGSEYNDRIRVVPLPDKTIRLVEEFIRKHKRNPNDFVFQKSNGEPIGQVHLESVFNSVLEKAGIDTEGRKIVPHSLRYTYVTRMRRLLAAEEVQKLAGHSSVKMTQYYTRSSIPELIASVQNSIEKANTIFSD